MQKTRSDLIEIDDSQVTKPRSISLKKYEVEQMIELTCQKSLLGAVREMYYLLNKFERDHDELFYKVADEHTRGRYSNRRTVREIFPL